MKKHPGYADSIQKRYAGIIARLVAVGLAVLAAAFVLYASGLLPSSPPIEDMPELWHLDAPGLAERLDRPAGWGWIAGLGDGQTLAFAALVLLAATSIVALAVIGVTFVKNRSFAYATIVALQLVVLLLAASGLIRAGG